MSNRNFPTIPDPNPDVRSLFECLKVVKQILDILTGTTKGTGLGAGHMPILYLDAKRPDPANVSPGDFWLNSYSQLFVCSPYGPFNMIDGIVNRRGPELSQPSWVPVAAVAVQPADQQRASFETTKTSGGMNR